MEWVVVLIEAIICVASYVAADYMVTHRKGLAKGMVIGQDSKEDKLEMLKLAVTAFDGKDRGATSLKDYTLSITISDGKIAETMVETKKTLLTYNEKDGERFVNKGFSETGATIVNTVLMILLATCLFLICVILFL